MPSDSVTIAQIQNPAASCHPALSDTAMGVGGIITGFDPIPTGFGFYIQNRGVANYAGLDIFTGSTNQIVPYGLALGDSVVVYGQVTEFNGSGTANGETELTAFNGSFGNNPLVIRKISSGNSLPAFTNLTTTGFNFVPTVLDPGVAAQEKYEGMLVKITNTPLVVRRIDAGAGDGLNFGTFLCTAKTGAQDTVMIDIQTLMGSGATVPSVGTQVTFLQGIANQRVADSKSTYRIQPRSSSDITIASPPQLLNAYAIAPDSIRVLFDRDITSSSASNVNHYALTSGRDVLGAARTASGEVRLKIDVSVPYNSGDVEGLTVLGLVSAATPDTMKTPDSDTFVGGVVPPSEVQLPDATALSGSPCIDRSRFAGTGGTPGDPSVTMLGVCVAKYNTSYYINGLAGGVRNGVQVFAPSTPLTVGHKYLMVGQVQEFGSGALNGPETEFVSTAYIADQGAVSPPAPTVKSIHVLSDTTCDIAQVLDTGEDWEGVLVRVNKAYVTETRTAGQSFIVAGPGADSILVSNFNSAFSAFAADSGTYVQLTGILGCDSRSTFRFRIDPRSDADIVLLGGAGVGDQKPKSIQFSVAPNPARVPRFSFALPTEADVDISVYDLSGRRVATVEHSHRTAGSYSASWNGLDARGGLAGSGMYFYRLRVGNEVRTTQGIKLN